MLRTEWESGIRAVPGILIDLNHIPEMKEMLLDTAGLRIGSQVKLSALRKHAGVLEKYPLLTEAAKSVAAPSIRNLAAVGGNIAAGTGDLLPALLLYEAELVWLTYEHQKVSIGLAEWLERKKDNAFDPAALLLEIYLPPAGKDRGQRIQPAKHYAAYHKVGRREAFTPSLVTTAVSYHAAADGSLSDVRIAAGGGKTIPVRFIHAEQVLEGSRLSEELLSSLYERILKTYDPAPDVLVSKDYRRKTAAHLITADFWRAMQLKTEGGVRDAKP